MSDCYINCANMRDCFFCGLSPSITDFIDNCKTIIKYKKGDIVSVSGQEADGIYCIQSGKVKTVRKDPNGKDAIISIKAQGELIGHHHLFQGSYYLATVTALEDTLVYFIQKNCVMKALEQFPQLAVQFLKHLSQELSYYEIKITSLVSKNVKSRLAELLTQMGAKYGTQLHEGLRIDLRLTREEIASIIGTVNETVTRFITEFKDCGFIKEEEKVLYIVKPEKLKEIASL